MKNHILVSIIIPAYNTELYIEEMLECVCRQTYWNLEIIVIDDGSTDSTALKVEVKQKEDERIQLLKIKNGGVSNARNVGIENAHGEKVFFWDSDDIIEYDTIENVVNFCVKNDVNAVLYGYANFVNGKKGDKFPTKLRYIYRDREILNDLFPSFIGHSIKMYKIGFMDKRGLEKEKSIQPYGEQCWI